MFFRSSQSGKISNMPKKTRRKQGHRDVYLDMQELRMGLQALEDTTKAGFGAARKMKNMQITDRGGIGPRPGTVLLGTNNTNGNPVKGLYNFRKSFEQDEFLIKTYAGEMEVYSKNHSEADWFRLKNGFTSDKEFGFVTSLVNEDNEDYVIFSNRYEDYQTWNGAVTQINGALAGGETTITVDSTLTDEIFESNTATGNTSTTIDVSGAGWAASQWVNLYVHITSGAESGQIRRITANTSTQITFDALGGAPGNVTFEIRKLAFGGETGTVIYNGTTIAYTDIPSATELTVGSAHATADNAALSEVPTTYPENPKGNRFTNYLGRIVVGNVRSALARDAGGSLQGFSAGGSYFVSQINDPVDFTFAATRAAGEGDIISTPYGGGEITDVTHQEDTVYVFKERYIEAAKYTQDSNDVIQREPLKAETGSVGPVIKGSDDVYFITADKKFTSLGRVQTKDIKPQTENLGLKIKRILDNYVFGEGRGIEYKDRIYIPAKSGSTVTANDVVLVYNKRFNVFEGIWDLSVNYMQEFNEGLYMGDSLSSNVYQMLTGHADVEGDDRFPISASYATHFFNLTASHSNLQAMNSIYLEGYIRGGTSITFELWKDFSSNAFLEFDFGGTEEQFLDGEELSAFLGAESLGLSPIGSIGEQDPDGRRHFYFRVYFPFQYGNHFSIGFKSSGTDDDYEMTRIGLGMKESVSTDTNRVKST